MEEPQKNNRWVVVIIILIVSTLLVYWWYNKTAVVASGQADASPIVEVENQGESEGGDENQIIEGSSPRPQYSKENPIPLSVDPFEVNEDFETLEKSNKNKTDFDFTFEGQDNIPSFSSNGGRINFELKGKLMTSIDLEKGLPLAIEFFTNDQISLSRRQKSYDFDLPFVKETEKVKSDDKILYSFDFNATMKLDQGLYYFLVIPKGRNRILHMGRFFVK